MRLRFLTKALLLLASCPTFAKSNEIQWQIEAPRLLDDDRAPAGAFPFERLSEREPGRYRKIWATPECKSFDAFAMSRERKTSLAETDTFLMLKDDQVIYESYAENFRPEQPHRLFSATKFIMNLVVGTAVNEGRLRLNQKVSAFLPAKTYRPEANDNVLYERLTVRDLLLMQSGFDWQEREAKRLADSSVLKMMFTKVGNDATSYVLSHKLKAAEVGKVFNYSSGDYVLLAAILKRVYKSEYKDMPWKNLFEPMGLGRVIFEQDAQEVFRGGSNAYVSTLGLAKLGRMILNNGVSRGRQILPENWITMMRTPASGQMNPLFSIERLKLVGLMGSPFYLNNKVRGLGRLLGESWPADTHMAVGFMGQSLILIPSLNMIIVRTGWEANFGEKSEEFGRRLMACLSEGKFL